MYVLAQNKQGMSAAFMPRVLPQVNCAKPPMQHGLLHCGLHATEQHLDQLNELIGGTSHGDAPPDNLLAHIQVDLARGTANIAKISISHLSRSIHNAPHHSNGYTCKDKSKCCSCNVLSGLSVQKATVNALGVQRSAALHMGACTRG